MNRRRVDTLEPSALLAMIPCPALAIDDDDAIHAVNEAMGQLIGMDNSQFVGRRLSEFVLGQEIQQSERQGRGSHTDQLHVMRCGGGTIRLVLENRGPNGFVADSGELAIVTLANVTALKRSEEGWHELCTHISRLSDTVIEEALRLRHRLQMAEGSDVRNTLALRDAYFDAVYMLAMASEARDQQTGAHLRRIAAYTRAVATALCISGADADDISSAAILHDVGKLHLPDALLQKNGPLSDNERRRVQEHTLAGERMFPDKPAFALARQIARSHHENWDGSGYPDGLRGEAIPQAARIVHVADVFDALVSARPYKDAWPTDRAVEYLTENAGTLFEPCVVDAFVQCVRCDDIDPIAYCCMLSASPVKPGPAKPDVITRDVSALSKRALAASAQHRPSAMPGDHRDDR